MMKKILSLGIALAMLITLLPCSTYANDNSPTALKKIYATVKEPIAYELPSKNFTFDTNTKRALDTKQECVVRWYVYIGGNHKNFYDNYRLMDSDEYFMPGKTYLVSIDFYITDNYYYNGGTCKSYINKDECGVISNNNYIRLSKEFFIEYESEKPIQRLAATIDAPVAGSSPSNKFVLDIKPKDAIMPHSKPVLKWYKYKGEGDLEGGPCIWSDWEEISSDHSFVDGDLYLVSIEFLLKENYILDFDRDIQIMINNAECSIEGYNNKIKLYESYYVHKFGDYRLIEKASFGKTGLKEAQCENCGEQDYINIPAAKTPILSSSTYDFNNTVRKPTVTVKDTSNNSLAKSVDYAKGRKNVGKYSVKVKLTGSEYYGSKTVYFVINPPVRSIASLSSDKKALTVKWKKPSSTYRKQISGYEIRYSTSSKMTKAKTVKVKGSTSTKKTLTKLSAKKKYYVQIRTYKQVGGKTYKSSWSSVISAKTK